MPKKGSGNKAKISISIDQELLQQIDEFCKKHYNAETVFSMIKKKFGMSLRSKTETGQDNEILCKALCHNICVLIQEMFELGISAEFLEPAKQDFCADKDSAQEVSA